MVNLKFYKKLYQFMKEGGKSNRKTNTWEFALFMSVMIKKDIRCIDIIKFLFDYSYEFSPAEKQINPLELANSFKELGSYEKVGKKYGLSYNTVRNKIDLYNEFMRYLNSIGADNKFIERVYKFIDYTQEMKIRELLEFRDSPREESNKKNQVKNKRNKVNRGYKDEGISIYDEDEGISIYDEDEGISIDDEWEYFHKSYDYEESDFSID